jgi:hypothetical protein
MTHITGHDRRQTLLLPEAVDDYVGAEKTVLRAAASAARR